MMKNKAGWVALIVLAIASLLMIFFVMPNISGIKDKPVAEAPVKTEPEAVKPPETQAGAPEAAPVDPKTARATPADETAGKPADVAAVAPKPVDPAAGWAVPGFDVLRVEPDGSTVIAGRAQPNTKIEIVNGDAVVASTDVGSSGDFAAVFDKPLAPGDYQLSLRSVGKDGATKSSQEVATVSVPKDKASELLAMVSKPGEASRIITSPAEAAKPAQPATPAAQPATTAPQAATAAPQPSTATPGPVMADDAAKAPADEQPKTDTALAAPQAPSAAGDAAASATVVPAAPSPLSVSAVEIEGRKIFVAGTAKPGALVRIYADDVLVGEMKADPQGRFVIDGVLDLAVGQHTIRADMIAADGKTVDLRAAVPFDRPEGDQIAAVAQDNAAGTVASFDGGSFDALRVEATKAFGLLKGLFAAGSMPGAEQLAAARSATEIALNSLAQFKVADTLDAGVKDMVQKTSRAAASALSLLKAVPTDAASVSAALPRIEAAVSSALMPRTDGAGAMATATPPATVAEPKPETPVADSGAAKPAAPVAAQDQSAATPPVAAGSDTTAAATEPVTVQQAPLQQSKSSVIIRRGDTLWQISRRVYGAGVRYTTIYLANEDQISDPDRILPGQVFGVPDTAMPEAESEQMHRQRVQHKS